MRQAIIIARKHGQEKFFLLSGAEVPYTEQRAKLKALICAGPVNEEFGEVQLWTSDAGRDRVAKFATKKQADAEAAKFKADTEAHTKSMKAMETVAVKPEPAKKPEPTEDE